MPKARYLIVDTKNGQIFNGRTGFFQDQVFATPGCIYASRTKRGGRSTVPSEACEKHTDRLGSAFLGGDVREVEMFEIDYLRNSVFASKFQSFLDRHPSIG